MSSGVFHSKFGAIILTEDCLTLSHATSRDCVSLLWRFDDVAVLWRRG